VTSRLRAALVFTFLAHGAAMLLMLAFLLPMVPGGSDATGPERIARIAASPLHYRLGWAGWQVTALSDLLLAVAIVTAPKISRRVAWISFALTVAAIVPDQLGQALLVTHGVDLAREAVATANPALFLDYEAVMFPLTSAWAAVLYTAGAVGWCFAFASAGTWSRTLTRLSTAMLGVFAFASITPLLPHAIRPAATLVGAANAVGFAMLEAWFILLYLRGRSSLRTE
jgi:hypothetical protein